LPDLSLRASFRHIAMKPLAILLTCSAAAAFAATDDIIPKPFPKDRYAETAKKSPFVLETKAVEPEATKAPFGVNLHLSGVGKADGKDYVLVKRLGEDRAMRFIGNEPGSDGISVKSVRLGDNFRETKVVLQKDGETYEIGFKEDAINAPPAAPGGRQTTLPGQFPKSGNPMPTQRNFPPGMPGAAQTVPRPGSGVPAPPMPQPNATQPATLPQPPSGPPVRNRVRAINN
jgi:hypothetical protein